MPPPTTTTSHSIETATEPRCRTILTRATTPVKVPNEPAANDPGPWLRNPAPRPKQRVV
jgi:hypothetical protein